VRPGFAYVAVAMLAAALLVINLPLNRNAQLTRFATARGEQSSIVLPDGSDVLLNHTSSIEFETEGFSGSRTVILSGEAFFSIQHGSPFVVTTDAGSVTVTGTKFNVRVRDSHYEVGVTEGSVRTVVSTAGQDTTIALSAGEALSGTRDAGPSPVRAISASYPGWTERTLLFNSMDLASVCDELENAFDVRITLEDPGLGSLTVSGAFDARDVNGIIASVCSLTGRNYRYEEGAYILY